MSAETVNVAITGAGGQIGYSLIPEILRGEVFGERPINLRLLEVTPALAKLEGVAMEASDLASPYLNSVDITDDPTQAFDGVNFAFLVGSQPRTSGMNRDQLLEVNGPIFQEQGRELNDGAAGDVRVLVVGNPANSNALVALCNAPDIPVDRFSAMSRLDHNRAVAAVAAALSIEMGLLDKVVVWGNHSDSMVVDLEHVETPDLDGNVKDRLVDTETMDSIEDLVAHRGGDVMRKREASSAMSAAHAAAEQARDWLNTSWDRWHSMAVYSNGQYAAPEGVIFSFPVTSRWGEFEIVEGLELSAVVKIGLDISGTELMQERARLRDLGMLAVER